MTFSSEKSACLDVVLQVQLLSILVNVFFKAYILGTRTWRRVEKANSKISWFADVMYNLIPLGVQRSEELDDA